MDEKSQNWCFDKNLPVLDLGGIIAIGKLVGKKVKTGIFFVLIKFCLPAYHCDSIWSWFLGDIQATANYLGKNFFSSIDR